MDLIFLAFANSQDEPLGTLQEEDDKVYSILARRMMQQHFVIHRDSHTTIQKIAENLLLFKDYLTVFLYSGHAGESVLLLNDEVANAEGIAGLLGQCPKLRLVILNGCATKGQVERLLALPNKPVVIATSAKVDDRAATQFSISFFQLLSEQYGTIEEAFAAGVEAAKLVALQPVKVSNRDVIFQGDASAEESDLSLWGIYHGQAETLTWKLPNLPLSPVARDFTPNELLIEKLVEHLSAYQEELVKIYEDESMGMDRSILDKREAILKCLPHPISEQLRKLIVPGDSGSAMVFFDKLGPGRLQQMVNTYNTLIEMLVFAMLAQLWDALNRNKELARTPEIQNRIRELFALDMNSRAQYNFFPLLRSISLFFKEHNIAYFIEELDAISAQFDEHTDLYNACTFMETIRGKLARGARGVDQTEAEQLCMIAEEKLARVIGDLGFISRYTLASVKDIGVIKYRHFPQARFKHKLVKLVQRFVGLEEEDQVLEEMMYTDSILLMRTGEQGGSVLNLSPFIIDENAFDAKASSQSKLHFFDRYARDSDVLAFKHVYKPEDPPLVVHTQKNYRMVRAQFDAFSKLLFNKPLKDAV